MRTGNIERIVKAANDNKTVKGQTHHFYNYPARFSPLFVREIIETLSRPGDLVVDPFVGGGTTLVEARLAGRDSIGLDISPLAVFISKVKTTVIEPSEIAKLVNWSTRVTAKISVREKVIVPVKWKESGYQKNLTGKEIWKIRKVIELYVSKVDRSKYVKAHKDFLRCIILKSAQWALDNKRELPSVKQFKDKLIENTLLLGEGAVEFHNSLSERRRNGLQNLKFAGCYNLPAHQISSVSKLDDFKSPKLIVTSPPYPGLHILYHRWQVKGRRETSAPFWIANAEDGHTASHYTMGDRKQKNLNKYFNGIKESFEAIKTICGRNTIVVQMVAFSDIESQLPRYLKVMESAGFSEVSFSEDRIWRNVPNRKWYANLKGETNGSNEVVLFHKLTTSRNDRSAHGSVHS